MGYYVTFPRAGRDQHRGGWLMRSLALTALFALAACATQLPQTIVERDGDIFDVRYDAAVQTQAVVDAKANSHCANGACGVRQPTNRVRWLRLTAPTGVHSDEDALMSRILQAAKGALMLDMLGGFALGMK